jgi:hypothetical protein
MRSLFAPAAPAAASIALLSLALAACAGGAARDPNTPLSPAAQKVEVVKVAPVKCKKLGSATGQGRDLLEQNADKQATDAGREQTAKLGGDTAHVVTETTEQEAGSGGTYAHVTKIIDVYKCGQ